MASIELTGRPSPAPHSSIRLRLSEWEDLTKATVVGWDQLTIGAHGKEGVSARDFVLRGIARPR
jgi:hypothetical protein